MKKCEFRQKAIKKTPASLKDGGKMRIKSKGYGEKVNFVKGLWKKLLMLPKDHQKTVNFVEETANFVSDREKTENFADRLRKNGKFRRRIAKKR